MLSLYKSINLTSQAPKGQTCQPVGGYNSPHLWGGAHSVIEPPPIAFQYINTFGGPSLNDYVTRVDSRAQRPLKGQGTFGQSQCPRAFVALCRPAGLVLDLKRVTSGLEPYNLTLKPFKKVQSNEFSGWRPKIKNIQILEGAFAFCFSSFLVGWVFFVDRQITPCSVAIRRLQCRMLKSRQTIQA